jgi:hypothetical protein
MTVSEKRLDEVFDNLLETHCIHQMSGVLAPLTEDELEAVYNDFIKEFAQELALGALEQSEWMCGNLIINANQNSIRFVGSALDAIRLEIECRGLGLNGSGLAAVQ